MTPLLCGILRVGSVEALSCLTPWSTFCDTLVILNDSVDPTVSIALKEIAIPRREQIRYVVNVGRDHENQSLPFWIEVALTLIERDVRPLFVWLAPAEFVLTDVDAATARSWLRHAVRHKPLAWAFRAPTPFITQMVTCWRWTKRTHLDLKQALPYALPPDVTLSEVSASVFSLVRHQAGPPVRVVCIGCRTEGCDVETEAPRPDIIATVCPGCQIGIAAAPW